ncbi:MAG: hypothetical protein A3F90_14465 [Deltaproteobacteria bacterium RIFCSPLOWO2_12_FULL_60_19]|nr:MAG: hypothetical protein A3F90_14465 [Deltaproteobacteria bacterium RIFCSPLOWO2_12_FULL_60_19]
MRKVVWILLAVSLWTGCSAGVGFVPQELQGLPAGQAVQLFYASQGGAVEAYLIRPRGQGPFPLLVLLHGHSWVGVGASRMVPIAEQFAADLAMPDWRFLCRGTVAPPSTTSTAGMSLADWF